MNRKIVYGLGLTALLVGLLMLAFNIQRIESNSGTITVPDDYSTIQEAINNAREGDTVYVKTGTYYENVVVNKTVSLCGESKETTVVDSDGVGVTINVCADNVAIMGFTIRNSSSAECGIFLGWGVSYSTVSGNNITLCQVGISIWDSSNHTIYGNDIVHNDCGILFWFSNATTAFGNSIKDNLLGMQLQGDSFNNFFYHNNFINNTDQVNVLSGIVLTLDGSYPCGGNYWSDYNGSDNFWGIDQNLKGCDMIGDTPYVINENNTDNYPLMMPWRPYRPPITEFPDLNGDGKITIKDLFIVAKHFGEEFESP